jgi:hypothetical protein
MATDALVIKDLARRIAAEYHDMNPDKEFHRIWPNADAFVRASWREFREAARKMLAEREGKQYLVINGEEICTDEATELVRWLYNEAKQAAGEFHGQDRSEKFRKNWPDEYVFADANWKSFVQEARKRCALRLGDPRTTPEEARRIHLALVIEAEVSKGKEIDPRLQIERNTQQFEGDPFENRKIVDQFGKQSNTFKELLMASASKAVH